MAQHDKQFSFRSYAWGQFKKNRPAYISLWVLGFLAVIALIAPILANDQPLYASYKGETMFPAFSFKKIYEIKGPDGREERIQLDIAKWKQMKLDAVIWAPVAYAPSKSDFLNSKTNIAVDSMVSRLIEILVSVPSLILILSFAAIAKPSMVNLMLIIGLTGWTGIARLTRAEFLKIRNLEYIQAGQALGFSEARIIFRHALPNGIGPAFVVIAFGIAGAILAESSLSFLGVGVPPEMVTWGSLLNSGRAQFNAWWLVIFPGMAIFITVAVYNLLGDGIRDAIDPRLKT